MTSHHMVPVFVLMSACLATAGPEPSTRCELSPISASHPVQALMESFTVLSGCASRGTTGLPREVHILNLRSTDQGLGQPQREVTLHLNPIASVHTHHKPVVFLLNSPQPLVWHVKTERLAAGVPRLFLVSVQHPSLKMVLVQGYNDSGLVLFCFVLRDIAFLEAISCYLDETGFT